MTDRRTDEPMDQRTNERTYPLIEMRGASKKELDPTGNTPPNATKENDLSPKFFGIPFLAQDVESSVYTVSDAIC